MKRVMILAAIIVAGLLGVSTAQAQVETYKVDISTTPGAAADGTVSITRDTSGNLVLRDAVVGEKTLTELLSLTIGDLYDGLIQGMTTGAGDTSVVTMIKNVMAFRLGAAGALTANGAPYTSSITTVADARGNVRLGAHLQDAYIHWVKPSRVITVGKDDTTRRCDFTTIQGALDSITDSSASKYYVVLVYPGIYTEQVTLSKSYVMIRGFGPVSLLASAVEGPTLQITATTPLAMYDMSISNAAVGGVAVQVDSASMSFGSCTFQANNGTCMLSGAPNSIYLQSCRLVEIGTYNSVGMIVPNSEDYGKRYWYLYNCDFSAAHGYVLASASAEVGDCDIFMQHCRIAPTQTWVDGAVMDGSTHEGAMVVRAVGCDFGSLPITAAQTTSEATFYYSNVRAETWCTTSTAVTSAPLTAMLGNTQGDFGINDGSLKMNGTTAIDGERQGSLTTTTIDGRLTVNGAMVGNTISATTGTFASLTASLESLTLLTSGVSELALGDGDTTGILRLDPDAEKFTMAYGPDELPKIVLNHDSSFGIGLYFGEGTFALLGSDGFPQVTWDAVTHAWTGLPDNSAATTGMVAAGTGQASKVWKTDGSGNPAWRDDATGGGGGASTNPLVVAGLRATTLYSADLATSEAAKFLKDGSRAMTGNLTMGQNYGVKIPDGTTSAPYSICLSACCPVRAWDGDADILENVNIDIGNGRLEFTANPDQALVYPLSDHVPSRMNGAKVVLDRITCTVYGDSGNDFATANLVDESGTVLKVLEQNVYASGDILTSDYIMPDNLAVFLKFDITVSESGSWQIFKIQVEYHTQ